MEPILTLQDDTSRFEDSSMFEDSFGQNGAPSPPMPDEKYVGTRRVDISLQDLFYFVADLITYLYD